MLRSLVNTVYTEAVPTTLGAESMSYQFFAAPFRQPTDKRKIRGLPMDVHCTLVPPDRVPSDWDGMLNAAKRLVQIRAVACLLTDDKRAIVAAVTLRDGAPFVHFPPKNVFHVTGDGNIVEKRATTRTSLPKSVRAVLSPFAAGDSFIVGWHTEDNPHAAFWCDYRAEAVRVCQSAPPGAEVGVWKGSPLQGGLLPAWKYHNGIFTPGKQCRRLPDAHPIEFLRRVVENTRVRLTVAHRMVTPNNPDHEPELFKNFTVALFAGYDRAITYGDRVDIELYSASRDGVVASLVPEFGTDDVTATVSKEFMPAALPPTPFEFPQGYILVPSLWNDGTLAMPGLKRDKRQAEPTEIQHSLESLLVCAKKYGRRECDVAPLIEAARVFIDNGHEVPEKHRAFAEKKGLLAP